MRAASRIRTAIALSTLARLLLCVDAQACAQAITQAITQTGPAVIIGWAELDTSAVDKGFAHVGALLPRLLLDATAFVSTRLHTEPVGQDGQDYSLAVEKARTAVAQARYSLDMMTISEDDALKRQADRYQARIALHKAKAALLALLIQSPSDEQKGMQSGLKPLSLWSSHATGALIQPVSNPAGVCKEQGIDILVYGTVRQLSGFLACKLYVYLAAEDRIIEVPEEYASPDNLEPMVLALTRPTATAIMGRAYARLTLAMDPPHARLRIDGRDTASRQLLVYEERNVSISLNAPNYVPLSTDVLLVPGIDTALSLSMVRLESGSYTVASEPQGASVYVDGLLAGTTPLELPVSEAPRIARLSMPGMEDSILLIRPGTTELPALVLQADDGQGFKGRFAAAKDGFYNALGWFVASLPLSVLSYGTFSSYQSTLANLAAQAPVIDPVRADALLTGFYTTQTVFWVSAAASAGLAVHAIVRLVLYIRSAN